MPLIYTLTHQQQQQLAAMQGTNQLVRSNWGLSVSLRDTSTHPGWDRTGNPPTARRQLLPPEPHRPHSVTRVSLLYVDSRKLTSPLCHDGVDVHQKRQELEGHLETGLLSVGGGDTGGGGAGGVRQGIPRWRGERQKKRNGLPVEVDHQSSLEGLVREPSLSCVNRDAYKIKRCFRPVKSHPARFYVRINCDGKMGWIYQLWVVCLLFRSEVFQ